MKKISRTDAYQGMDEVDHKVMEQELHTVFNSDQRNGREFSYQFFLDNSGDLVLEMYWDGMTVHSVRFNNKATLSEEGKKAVNKGILEFSHEEISERYQEFVQSFMSAEENVVRTKLLPHFWVVSVPSKDFKVSITCECTGHFHGIEQWCAVVEEPNGEKSNFLLFEDEIEQWASEQRKKRGIE